MAEQWVVGEDADAPGGTHLYKNGNFELKKTYK
jgi:hypothetical protein